MDQSNLINVMAYLRSAEARPVLREAAWAGAVALGLILLAALIAPRLAYALYLAVAVFFAATLTGLFVSVLEKETGERVVHSLQLRLWVGACALVLALMAALILV